MRISMRAAGFSLIEMLVAVGVLAVLASVSFRGLNSILDAETGVGAETRRWNELAIVTSQFGRDLALAVARPIRNDPGIGLPALSLGQGLSSPGVPDTGTELALTRVGDAEGTTANGELRRVGWRMRNGSLEYLVWPAVDAAAGVLPSVSTVLENVSEFKLRALGSDGVWRTVWPALGMVEALPRAVEIQILLAGRGRITRLFALR